MILARRAIACLRRVVAGLLLCAVGGAQAQTSFAAGLVTDYRVRGMSFSEDGAVPQLSANFDGASGLYAGALLTRASLRYTEMDGQALAYAGYARRFGEALAWEVGASASRYRHAGNYDYHELYAGLSAERLGVRLYYAPRYFGIDGRSAYLEANGSYPLCDWLDLVGHAGYVYALARESRWLYRPAPRTDLRLGLSATSGPWALQLSWVGVRRDSGLYPGAPQPHPRTLLAGVVRNF